MNENIYSIKERHTNKSKWYVLITLLISLNKLHVLSLIKVWHEKQIVARERK